MLLHQLPTFIDADKARRARTAEDAAFHVAIESPRGSTVKLKFDAKLGAMTWSRPLPVGVAYPFDWGFIPSTQAPDGDPLDAMVIGDTGVQTGVIVACRALGVLQVEQNRAGATGVRERNDRVIALPLKSPRADGLATVFDLPERLRDELSRFFINVTAFEGKDPSIVGWEGPDAARTLILDSAR
jgi:inorganic pyrophosphatase